MAQINGVVSVQSLNEGTLIVKVENPQKIQNAKRNNQVMNCYQQLSNGRIQRVSNFQGSVYQGTHKEDSSKGIGANWEPIGDMEHMEIPFVINHKKGSVSCD